MTTLFRGAKVYENGVIKVQDMLFDGVSVSLFTGDVSAFDPARIFDNIAIFPGFCDVHVHLREPGFSYKEDIASGTRASARGGYTTVCAMPNLIPPPDSPETLGEEIRAIERSAVIEVLPYGTITKGQAGTTLSDMQGMADKVVAFSDDGRGIQTGPLMREAMLEAKRLGKMIVAHCEDNSLLFGGYIHDGEYAKAHGHKGISSESEWGQIKRDIELVRETGCQYHVCHISTKESVELIREAKRESLPVSCETGPHYILLDDSVLEEDGRFKMNPPLRSPSDKEAILMGVLDGTIEIIATDHAPHTAEEKAKGLKDSPFGVVGIETAFPLLYTNLVLTGLMPLEELIALLSDKPRERFGITGDTGFTVFDLGCEYEINPDEFLSKGKSTPFKGAHVAGRCLATVYRGKAAYLADDFCE